LLESPAEDVGKGMTAKAVLEESQRGGLLLKLLAEHRNESLELIVGIVIADASETAV
jgi:hypothetical protein